MTVTAKEKINEYLKSTGLTQRELAVKCRISPEGLCRALKRETLSAMLADKIDYYTRGIIPYSTLTQEPRPKKRRNKKAEEVF
jgi:transcriptional regulator with XRE-family HTH domain